MEWLSRLFRPFEPPTENQLRFAEALGIRVTSRMSKQDVSAAISQKQADDPKAYGKAGGKLARGSRRAAAVVGDAEGSLELDSDADKAWLKTPEGREAAALYKQWARVTASEPYGIFVYRQPGTGRVEVDVARVAGADCDHDAASQVRVVLDVALPEVVRDKGTGFKILEWTKSLAWFPAADVLIWEKLPKSFEAVDGCAVGADASAVHRRLFQRYEAACKKGRAVARERGIAVGR